MDVETPVEATPTEYVPPSRMDPLELAKALVEDGVIEAVPKNLEPAPAKEAPPAAPPEPAKKSEDLPALVRIAKERDAFRKEMEAAKPHLEAFKAFSPQEAARLAKARQAGDPVAALAALGFTHEQYTNRLINEPDAPAAPSAAPSSGNAELDAVRQELRLLQEEKAERDYSNTLSRIEAATKENPKFSAIKALGDWAGVERVIQDYWDTALKATGQGRLPGDTFEESVELAAEVHEDFLRKQAEKYKVLLTAPPASASVPPKAPVAPPGPANVRTLTNANTSAPAAVRNVPKTRQEILEAIIEGREDSLDT